MTDTLAVCWSCGTPNRMPADKPAAQAKCAKCGTHLFDGHPPDVTADNLKRQVARSTLPVVVDIWAPWCQPCVAMAPAYAKAARELEPDFRLVKLNSDAAPEAAAALGIRGIPTMILFQGGTERARYSGALSTREIVEWARANV